MKLREVSLKGHIFVNDIFMFIEKTDVCNFADDNTIQDCGKDFSNILGSLKYDMKILLKCFRMNSLHANPGKFQFMILAKKKRKSVKLIMKTTETEKVKKQFCQISQLITL